MTMAQLKSFFTAMTLARSEEWRGENPFRAGLVFRKHGAPAGALLLLACTAPPQAPAVASPGAPETRIERSCRLDLGRLVRGAGEGAALEIVGDGITVELAGELHGAEDGAPADTFRGVGIHVTGKNVTLRG